MSSAFNITAILQLIPSGDDTAWIAPWVEQVLGDVSPDQNPYSRAIDVIRGVFYPEVVRGFKPQLWFLLGLFALSIIIILVGLALRLKQGRFWLVHRIDSTIVIPNISVVYGLCSLIYAGLGIFSIITAVRIADGKDFPLWWVGLQSGWTGPLWTGIYCECWATICGWYIRKKGAFYKESRFKTIVAVALPFILPLFVWGPPVGLFERAAHNFNTAVRTSYTMVSTLHGFESSWTPGSGIDVVKLLNFFPIGSKFGTGMVEYYRYVRAGYVYVTVCLAVTFVVYIIGATLEIAHLNKTIHKLREQAKLTPRARTPAAFDTDNKVDEQLEDEMFAGQKRQWTLLVWARNNRIHSAVAISFMLLVNAALTAWLGATPISISTNSAQFQVEILVSCWLNGILTTVVSLLILFRSLDGSSPTVATLRRYFPFLPLPPAISISHPSRATNTMNPKTTMSKFDEPPKYPGQAGGYGRGGAASPIMEERKTPRPTSPTLSFGPTDRDIGEDTKAWFGLGVSGSGRDDGLHVVLEMQEAGGTVRYAPEPSIQQEEVEEDVEPEIEYEEPPRHGFGGDDHLDELPYQETHHAQFEEDESAAEEGFEEMRARQDSWTATGRHSGARRDSWD
ncbi:hypothetical protein JCM8547_001649 [Rhodosporidiobolus lusitaniae]